MIVCCYIIKIIHKNQTRLREHETKNPMSAAISAERLRHCRIWELTPCFYSACSSAACKELEARHEGETGSDSPDKNRKHHAKAN